MLQWMGGSRRKVTDSRKSTQKRQKQYFEQRRRQQQQQPTCTEGHTSGINVGQQHQKEQGSLDVLSFLNLSSISENTKSSHPKGNVDQHTNCHTQKGQELSITNALSGCAAETDEAIPSPGHQEKVLPAENRDSFCSSKNNASSKINSKPDLWNAPTEGLSVFDFLGDDDGDDHLQGGRVHESHVAFSVEGLGTVGAQTPPQSPTPHVRTSRGLCFPLRMTTRELGSLNNDDNFIDSTEQQVEEVIEDTFLPRSGKFSDFLPCALDLHANQRQKPSFLADSLERDSYSCALRSSLQDTSNVFSHSWENSWEDTHHFVEDFLDERDDDFWKTWRHQPYGRSNRPSKAGDNVWPNYMVRGANPLKKRDFEITEFSIPDSSSPQNQKPEFNNDFSRNRIKGKSSFSFGDVGFQQDWSNPATEHTKNNTSLLSEGESCSSSAVWGGESISRDPDITSRKSGRTCNIFGSTWSKQSPADIYAKEVNHEQRDGLWRSYIPGPGMCTGKSISPDSGPPKHKNRCWFEDKTEMSENLLYGGSHSTKGKFGFGSFTHASNTDFSSLYSKSQKVEPIAAFSTPGRHVDVNSIFNQEKPAFCQPFDCLKHQKSPVFSNVGCETTGDFWFDSAEEVPSRLDVASAHWKSELPALSAQGSDSRDEGNKSNHQSSKTLLGRTSGTSQKTSSTKNQLERASMTPKITDVGLKKETTKTPNLHLEGKAAGIAKPADETASSVKIDERSESTVDQNGTSTTSETYLPCATESTGNARFEETKLSRKKQGEAAVNASTEQVMMLESYVLQLLCVQKVPEVKGVSGL